MNKTWSVYLLDCADGTIYCGISNDVHKRLATHNKGKGAKYTRGRLPVTLKAARGGYTKSEALRLEYKVKQVRKENKEKELMS